MSHESQHAVSPYTSWSGWLMNAKSFLSHLQDMMRMSIMQAAKPGRALLPLPEEGVYH